MWSTSSIRESLNFSRLLEWLKQPLRQRIGRWLGGVFLAVVVLGFLVVPPWLKSTLVDQLAARLQRPVSIGAVAVNPLALSVTIDGFSVGNGQGGELAGFDRLYLNLSSASLFKLALVVDEIRLAAPRMALTRLEAGRYDIDDLLAASAGEEQEAPAGLPRFSLNNIEISDGRFSFDDRPAGKMHDVTGIALGLPFVSSLPYQAEVVVQPMFAAEYAGSRLNLGGGARPFAEGRQSEFDLAVDDFDLSVLQAYLPASVPLHLVSARLNSRLKAVFREVSAGTFSLAIEGRLQVSGLQLNERDGKPLLAWKELDVALDQLDPINRQIALERVALDGVDLSLAVDPQGRLNVLQLAERLKQPEQSRVEADPAPTPLAWSVGEIALSGGQVRWQDASNAQPVSGVVSEIFVRTGRLDSRLAAPIEVVEAGYRADFGEPLRIEAMKLQGLRVDLAAQRIDIAEVTSPGARVKLKRNAQGLVEWLSPPAIRSTPSADDRPWQAEVARLTLDDLALQFDDAAVQPQAVQRIERIGVRAERLGNVPGNRGKLAVQAAVNQHGKLEIDGDIRLAPLDLVLQLDSEAIPLETLQAYAGQYLNLHLQRGQFSNSGQLFVRAEGKGLQAGYKGSATLGNLRAVDTVNDADFLRWKSLYFGGIDFRLAPLAIDIQEIALSDFFSRLVLDASGQLNLANLVRRPAADPASTTASGTVPPSTGAPTAAGADSPAPQVAAPARPPIRIARVTLNNGSVNFSDFFVKPNYRVNIDKLGGRVTGLSSVEGSVADLELRGRYGSAAPVQITARLNPLAATPYLDLKATISDVDLTGFSPYSGKYAGYAIEKGKLSLDVGYKLENRQLQAENHLFIDQFTFGERVESPDATSLPVNLAIALLKNNRGEIDLNLPISGSLDDPQFSVGGLVVKVIVNLFVKAVTSPFALLGSMFGGEELSTIGFAPGRGNFDEAALKTLGNLARALTEREALKLEITGHADPETDREGLKQVALERAVRREKLADLRAAGDEVDAAAVHVTPEEYPAYLTRAYKAAKFPKPRNMIGLQKTLPVEEMEKLMLTNLPASDDDLPLLARRRAERVQQWLVDEGKVPPGRLFLLPPKAGAGTAKGGRVDFSLR